MRRARRSYGLAAFWALALVSVASGEPRLEYRGLVLPARQVESLAARALRSPADSTALASMLGQIVGRLQDQGYLDARARAEWDAAGTGVLRVEVAEGERHRLAAVAIQTISSEDSARLGRSLRLEPGMWASPPGVAEAIERALREVVDHGYPYAVLGVSRWDTDSSGVTLALSGALGPEVTVERVRIEGLRVTKRALVDRSMGRLVGLPYNRRLAESARDRVAQLGLFRSVTLEGLETEADWSRGHLVYRVEEPRYNRFEGAVGVQGDAGTVGLLRLNLDNLLGTGRAVGLHWDARGRGVSRLGARYAEPLLLGTPLRLEGAFDQHVQDTIYVRTRWGARLRYALSAEERLEAGYEQERVVQERGEMEQARLQNTVFALERSTLEGPLGPRRGSRIRLEASQTFKSERLRPPAKRSARASAVEIRGEWHRDLTMNTGIALAVQSAARFSSQRVLPFFERYPLGGASSLRGFNEEAFRVDRYALSRLELRRFLGEGAQRVFVFWDHAHAATRVPTLPDGDALESLDRDGVGFGMRLEAAGGLLGLDYGLAPGDPPLEGKIHLQLVSTF